MSENLQDIYSALIKLVAAMVRHDDEPSTYIEELEFCKSTPHKDKFRRLQDNQRNYNLSHSRALQIKKIADKLRSEFRKGFCMKCGIYEGTNCPECNPQTQGE